MTTTYPCKLQTLYITYYYQYDFRSLTSGLRDLRPSDDQPLSNLHVSLAQLDFRTSLSYIKDPSLRPTDDTPIALGLSIATRTNSLSRICPFGTPSLQDLVGIPNYPQVASSIMRIHLWFLPMHSLVLDSFMILRYWCV